MKFVFKLITSPNGRWARIGLGIGMLIFGVGLDKWLLAVAGVLPLVAGLFDICLLAPLFKLPLKGSDIRKSMG